MKRIDKDLYSFVLKDPKDIVNNIIRKYCLRIDFPTASPVKHLKVIKQTNHVNYYLLSTNESQALTSDEIRNNEKELLPERKMVRHVK